MTFIMVQTQADGQLFDASQVAFADPLMRHGFRVVGSTHNVLSPGTVIPKLNTGLHGIFVDLPYDQGLQFDYWVRIYAGGAFYHFRRRQGCGFTGEGSAPTAKLSFRARTDSVLTDVTQVSLQDPANTYGVQNKLTGEIVVPAGTLMTKVATGVYEHSFAETDPQAIYRYYVKVEEGGRTHFYNQEQGPTIPDRTFYASTGCMQQRYGVGNVQTWGDLSNTGNQQEIDGHLTYAVAEAGNVIDDELRGGPYEVPFKLPIPTTIQRIACQLAGVKAYEARGTEDYDPSGSERRVLHRLHHQRDLAMRDIRKIRRGMLTLDGKPASVGVPFVATDTHSSDCAARRYAEPCIRQGTDPSNAPSGNYP